MRGETYTGSQSGPLESAGRRWESPLKTIHLVWVILMAVAVTCMAVGRNVLTKEEADKSYLRQDVYSRDYDNLTGRLGGIETRLSRIDDKLDRALEQGR